MQAFSVLDALRHRPVFIRAMLKATANAASVAMPSIATIITTTGTTGAGVRARVQ